LICPHCGYEAGSEQEECPLCGTPLEGREGKVPAGNAPDAARESAATRPGSDDGSAAGGTPWEAAGGIDSLFRTWWESLSDPKGFFSRVDWDGGWENPLLYYLLFSVVGAGLATLWSALLVPAVVSAVGMGDLVPTPSGGALLGQFFLSPFQALFALAVFAGASHLVLAFLADRPRGIGATARAFCYSAGPQLLLVVPFLGGVAALIWSAVLAAVGLRTAHRTTTGRAVGALVVTAVAYMAFTTVWGLVVQGALGGALPLSTAA